MRYSNSNGGIGSTAGHCSTTSNNNRSTRGHTTSGSSIDDAIVNVEHCGKATCYKIPEC